MKILASLQRLHYICWILQSTDWVSHPSNLINNPNINTQANSSVIPGGKKAVSQNKKTIYWRWMMRWSTKHLFKREGGGEVRVRNHRRVSQWETWCRRRARRRGRARQSADWPRLVSLFFLELSAMSSLRRSPGTRDQVRALNNWQVLTQTTTKSGRFDHELHNFRNFTDWIRLNCQLGDSSK